MRQIVVGYGEIGRAVGALIGPHEVLDEGYKAPGRRKRTDIMHICFPYSHEFLGYVAHYMKQYRPKHLIIYSTTPIGTVRQIPGAVHSPVEGKHPNLVQSLWLMTRWLGINDVSEAKYFADFFREIGLQIKLVPNSDHTEALKLLSTTEYGLNIEYTRYKQYVSNELNMDFSLTKEWNQEYNLLYKKLGLDHYYQKYVLDAPEGPKGGHCVTPNARLLQERFPSKLTEEVAEL